MTNFLVRLFIKNHENTENQNVRTAYGTLSGVVGILSNLVLFGVKLGGAFLINSISIMADAFNNLSDATSSIVSLIGVRMAGKPADKEHPFGHGRFEYIAAMVVSFLILLVGVSLARSSIMKIIIPEETGFSWILTVLLLLSAIVKGWLSFFNRKIGKKINSGLLKATSIDSRNDVLVTMATIISILINHFLDWNVDGYVGLAVSLFVIYSGFSIGKETLMPLLGEGVSREMYELVTGKIENYEGILGTHDLIMHNYGPSHVMASVHVEVDKESSLEKIHEIIDRIEREVRKETGIFLVIHIDPMNVDDPETEKMRIDVEKSVERMEPRAHIHDLRIFTEGTTKYLVFDLVLPHSYIGKETDIFLLKLEKKLREISPEYQCKITIEKSFVSE